MQGGATGDVVADDVKEEVSQGELSETIDWDALTYSGSQSPQPVGFEGHWIQEESHEDPDYHDGDQTPYLAKEQIILWRRLGVIKSSLIGPEAMPYVIKYNISLRNLMRVGEFADECIKRRIETARWTLWQFLPDGVTAIVLDYHGYTSRAQARYLRRGLIMDHRRYPMLKKMIRRKLEAWSAEDDVEEDEFEEDEFEEAN